MQHCTRAVIIVIVGTSEIYWIRCTPSTTKQKFFSQNNPDRLMMFMEIFFVENYSEIGSHDQQRLHKFYIRELKIEKNFMIQLLI